MDNTKEIKMRKIKNILVKELNKNNIKIDNQKLEYNAHIIYQKVILTNNFHSSNILNIIRNTKLYL